MSERTYYYKYSELGDWNVKIEDVAVKGDPALFGEVSYGATAPVVEKGANASYEVTAVVKLHRGNDGAETADNYFKRRVQFATTIKNLKGAAGHLVVVADKSTDKTTTTGAVSATASPAAVIPVTALIGLSVGEYALVINTSTNAYEIVTISAVNTSALTYEAPTTVALNSGATVARLHWYLPNCYLMGDVSVGGEDGAGSKITSDLELLFAGVDDPVHQV